MKNNVFAYCRASTKEQDATRSLKSIEEFCSLEQLKLSEVFIEYSSGAVRSRPQLNRLIEIMSEGDIVIIEAIDRLTRLATDQADKLLSTFKVKGVTLVVLNSATSLMSFKSKNNARMKAADDYFNANAAIDSREWLDTHHKRQRDGIEKAKKRGAYIGSRPDYKTRANVELLLEKGMNYREIIQVAKVSRQLISSVKKQMALKKEKRECLNDNHLTS